MEEQQRIAVFGASGRIGKAVTEALLTKSKYAVNGLMRNPEKLELTHPLLKLIKGDVYDKQVVEQALEGCFAVVVSTWRPIEQDSKLYTEAAKVISEACLKIGVKRVLFVSAAGILDEGASYYFENPKFPPFYLNCAKDHLGAFKVYVNAGLDVTAVCPRNITFDTKFTGKYVTKANSVTDNNQWVIGNEEIADFIVKEIQNPQYIGQRVSITNTE